MYVGAYVVLYIQLNVWSACRKSEGTGEWQCRQFSSDVAGIPPRQVEREGQSACKGGKSAQENFTTS